MPVSPALARSRATPTSILCTSAVPLGATPTASSTFTTMPLRLYSQRLILRRRHHGSAGGSAQSPSLTSSKPTFSAAAIASSTVRRSGSALPWQMLSMMAACAGSQRSYCGVVSHSYVAYRPPEHAVHLCVHALECGRVARRLDGVG